MSDIFRVCASALTKRRLNVLSGTVMAANGVALIAETFINRTGSVADASVAVAALGSVGFGLDFALQALRPKGAIAVSTKEVIPK